MSLIQMSVSGGAMILVIALLRVLALYRLPKRLFAALWCLPLVRLLIPFSIPAAFSVYSLFGRETQLPVVTEVVPAPAFTPNMQVEGVAAPVSGQANGIPFQVDVLLTLWLIGALACALFFLAAYVKCRREFRESLPVEDGYALAWLQAHRLRRTVSIRYSDRVAAPLTYGVLRPVILMPKNTDWDRRETLDYVLAHELAHIRRFDTLRKLAVTLALCVHWFNPLVWAMFALANRDIELACDEAVLRRFGKAAKTGYALTLIRMEERKSGLLLLGSHFSKNSIDERIRAIMKMKKNSLATLLAAVVLIGGAMAFFATSAKAENNRDSAPQVAYTSEEDTLLLRDGSGGMAYYSPDGGETWIPLTQEEYEEISYAPNVEWWTAEDYAAWLENEKKELESKYLSIIGDRGWTPSTGWFTWTQEMVDKTIAEYEEILALIENGYLVSKSVDGSEDTLIMSGGPYKESFEAREDGSMGPFGDVDYNAEATAAEGDGDGPGKTIAGRMTEYQPYGVSYKERGSKRAVYYNDQTVGSFADVRPVGSVFSVSSTEGGEIDLVTVYDRDGKLSGVKVVAD